MTQTPPNPTARLAYPVTSHLLALARRHAVSVQPNALDRMGQAITQMTGDHGHQDEVQLALIHLTQAGHVSVAESQRLLLAYLAEQGAPA
jgi:hypothetical protein